MLSKATKFCFGSHSKIAIIGGGTAGMSVNAQLVNKGVLRNDIRIFEPSKIHAYQPGFTLVAGGVYDVEKTYKPINEVYHKNTQISQLAVNKVDPQNNTIITEDGDKYTYDNLIIATGIQLKYDQIKGAVEALEDPNCPVGSAYKKEYAVKFADIVKNFKQGDLVFHEPQMPIKCAGAPQKVCFLTEHALRKSGVRQQTNISFYMAKGVVFGVPKYSAVLQELHKEKNVNINLNNKVIEVNKDTQTIVYEDVKTGVKSQKRFDALHLVPPQVAPAFIKESGLADAGGFVEVDKGTMQHVKFDNIWSLGDSSSLPTSKTAAAVFSQSPILVNNLLKEVNKTTNATQIYEGYTSCPITIGDNKLLLAEFKYDAIPDETFPVDQGTPRGIFYTMKIQAFPFAYWNFVPKGYWHGREHLLPNLPFYSAFKN